MENEHELDHFINVLRRAKNCDLALNILYEIQDNALFVHDLSEMNNIPWIMQIDRKKWIEDMKSKIDEAVELIEKDD